MKSIMKLVFLLVLFVLVNAQDDDQGQNTRRRFQVLRKPLHSLAEKVDERVREGSYRLSARVMEMLDEVKTRTESIEKRYQDQIKNMRAQMMEGLMRLKAVDDERKQLLARNERVSQLFESTKEEFSKRLEEQKDIIDRQMQNKDSIEPNDEQVLDNESKQLDKKVKEVKATKLIPMTRGLGDGYGRHLK